MMTRLLPLLVTLGLSSAAAQEIDPVCPDVAPTLDDASWLRALSLDLRGVVPAPQDYQRVEAGEDPEALIDEWLDTEAFAWEVVRHHRSLLWPNVTDIRLLSNRQRLKYDYADDVWYRYLVAQNYRHGPISCGDFPAEWDSDGELVLRPTSEGYVQEGYVMVAPYWDPDNPIRMCAFGAQEDPVSPWGTACDTYDGRYDRHCGCGPDLAWCDIPSLGHNGDEPNPPVASAIAGDVEHRVADIIQRDQSYLELLTGRTVFMNGPLAHFYEHQLKLPAHVRFNEVPVDADLVPELAFTDEDTWVPVELGPEQSGILTSTLYLMKFQTRRARANRFYSDFLCQPFQPPDGGLSDLDNPDVSLDLTQRAGCQYCHAILEPAGAHWGRWSEYGAGWLNPDAFPTVSEACTQCATTGDTCSVECDKYYVVDPLSSEEDPYLGWMQSYEFLEERHVDNVEQGPALLVQAGVADGRLQRCVARKTAQWLLGRELESSEDVWVDALAQDFVASEFRYDQLVKQIVTSDNYRRVR